MMEDIHAANSTSAVESVGISPIQPYAKYIWNAPFWMRAIHLPFSTANRKANLQRLSDTLNNTAQNGCIKHWYVEDLRNSADPWRLQLRLQHRLTAELESDPIITKHIRECLREHGLEEIITIEPWSARLYYEELGLGCVEHHFKISLAPGHHHSRFMEFVENRAFWSSIDFASMVDMGELSIQRQWPELRAAFRNAIDNHKLPRFTELENIADWKHVYNSTKSLNAQGLSCHQSTSMSAPVRTRDDDLAWTMCMDVILFRNSALPITKETLSALSDSLYRIGYTMDMRIDPRGIDPANVDLITGYQKVAACLVMNGENGSVDLCYSGFGMVALVCEEEPFQDQSASEGDEYSASASARVAALRRRALMSYAALTEAADALRGYLATMLLIKPEDAPNRHEQLRQIGSALAMIRYDARSEVVEADDIETTIYGIFSDAWGIEKQSDVLGGLIEDADRATSRISESNTHSKEQSLNLMVLGIAIITLVSSAQDFTSYAFSDIPMPVAITAAVARIAILIVIWVFAIFLGWRLGVLTRR